MLLSLFKSRFKLPVARLIVGALAAGQLAAAYAQNAQPVQPIQPSAATMAAAALNPRLARIAERYFEDHLVLNPLEASGLTGEARFDGLLTITIAPAQMALERALSQRVLAQLAAIKSETLSPADAMTYAVLKRRLQEQVEGDKFPKQLMPIDQS